jgi:hypothetical protein
MNIWTSKGLHIAALCLGVAGCDKTGGAGFGLGGGGSAPLAFAELARGAVTIVPPVGFCVDTGSLRANFALMARCDMLGGDGGVGMPAAIITATAVTAGADGITPEFSDERVLARRDAPVLSMVQVQGDPPIAQARDVFWRGAGRIGDQIIGLAIYQAEGNTDLGALAPELLVQTMQQSHNRTIAKAAVQQDNSATLDTLAD